MTQCPECKSWVFSRARHDFRECECGKGFVDGGHLDKESNMWVPERVGGSLINGKTNTVTIDVTPKELYDDWNERKDEYGIIHVIADEV